MTDFYLAKDIKPEDRERIVGNAKGLIEKLSKDKKWKISVALDKDKRSKIQNGYYWSGVLPAIRDYYDEHMGIYHSIDSWHEYFKKLILVPEVEQVRGEEISVYKTTTKLSPKEFYDYIERIAAEVAQDGCVVPPPKDPRY